MIVKQILLSMNLNAVTVVDFVVGQVFLEVETVVGQKVYHRAWLGRPLHRNVVLPRLKSPRHFRLRVGHLHGFLRLLRVLSSLTICRPTVHVVGCWLALGLGIVLARNESIA